MSVLAAPALDWVGGSAPQAESAIVVITTLAPVIATHVNDVLPAPDINQGGSSGGAVGYGS